MSDMTVIATNIRAMIEHAVRFELQARLVEDTDPDECEHLRYLSHDAQHQIEHLRKNSGEDTSIIKTGTIIAAEVRYQEYQALVNIQCKP